MVQPTYEVVWPLGKSVYTPLHLAERANGLGGKTICQLWDWLFKGDEVFSTIRERLSTRYPGVKFVDYTIFGNTLGKNEKELIAALPSLLRAHGCDAVISALGS
ncbi:MAG: hypothetical protein HYX92_20680 [Chloroflexi bacterium]|nr:hypothetical protein [Chloroflexota bacterium]